LIQLDLTIDVSLQDRVDEFWHNLWWYTKKSRKWRFFLQILAIGILSLVVILIYHYAAICHGPHDAGSPDCGICQRKGQSFPWKDLVLWPSLKSLLSQEISSESLSISSIESIIPTISLSAQATDLLIMAYIRDHNQEDCLLTGFHGKNSNPFREKSSCEVLWIGSSFIYKSWQPHFSMFFHLYSAWESGYFLFKLPHFEKKSEYRNLLNIAKSQSNVLTWILALEKIESLKNSMIFKMRKSKYNALCF